MRMPRSNSLAYRITLTVMLASSMALGTLTVTILLVDRTSSEILQQNRLSALADVVGQNSTAALSFDDAREAVAVLEALRAEPPVASACLYTATGRLFARYEREPGSGACPTAPLPTLWFPEDPARVVRPVTRQGELVGTLILTSDFRALEKRRDQVLIVSGLLGLLALAVGGLAGAFLQREISQPIFELVKAMDAVTAAQDFSIRVPPSGADEIRLLGRGFNAMIIEIERHEAAQKTAEAKLQYQAFNDALTGLPNRRLLADRLTQLLARAKRESRILALLYIDLDGFKLVNDSLGHSIGDMLLVQVAARLQSRVRQSDTLARLGGDEFTVVLADLHNKDEAALVAKSLLDVLVAPFVIEGHQLTIGASIGISIFPDNAKDAVTLTQQADSAMYASKRDGRGRATYFTPELGSLVRERLTIENELRGAVGRGEIEVHYQPEFDVETKKLVRFEALARWIHPTLGIIPPDKFIPVAEECGLIVVLGAYIMEVACTEALRWQEIAEHPIQVAVNVSTTQFKRSEFVQEVAETLKRTRLRPGLLQLELTETIMMTGIHAASETMQKLRELGVGFAIDDFGTGYSCLSYLPALPFDALKIDRAFVRDLEQRPESQAMVNSLVALAHNLGIRVIVEGVETTGQLDLIRHFGGNEVQGYLTGRPIADPLDQLPALLKRGIAHEEKKTIPIEIPKPRITR
ncbi:MAG TPA: EAL domain-containing protein [Terriglobales bacterium]|nr:EAL domain-containing protein [Terriglobales bacterium]